MKGRLSTFECHEGSPSQSRRLSSPEKGNVSEYMYNLCSEEGSLVIRCEARVDIHQPSPSLPLRALLVFYYIHSEIEA